MYASRRSHYGIPLLGKAIGRCSTVFIHTEAGAAMPAGSTLAQERARMRAIHLFHVARFGSGFGYTAGINGSSRAGRVHEGRGWFRSGAHTAGYNSTSYALVFFGNGDRQGVTDEAWAAVRRWIGDGIDAGALTPNPRVRGHREVAAKSCPGNLIYPHLGRLRGVTGREAAATTPPPAPKPKPAPEEEHVMFRFITSPQPKGTPDKIVLVNFCQGWASVCPHEDAAKVLSRKLGVPLEPRPVMNSGELAALGVTYRDTPAAWRNYRS